MEPQTDAEIFDQIRDLLTQRHKAGDILPRVATILKSRVPDGAEEYRSIQVDEISDLMDGTAVSWSEVNDPKMRELKLRTNILSVILLGRQPRSN